MAPLNYAAVKKTPGKRSPFRPKIGALRYGNVKNVNRRSVVPMMATSTHTRTLDRVRKLLDKDIDDDGDFEVKSEAGEDKSKASRLRVAVRVRPMSSREATANARDIISVAGPKMLVFDPPVEQEEFFFHNKRQKNVTAKKFKNQKFAFDLVYDREVTNQAIFQDVMQPLLTTLLNGFNCSVFAYGATGSGKTYTMLGGPDNPGLIYITMNELFHRLEEMKEEYETQIALSYFEVYNEQVRDLLAPTGAPLQIREVGNGINIEKLTFLKPETATEVVTILRQGNSHRSQHPTDHNAESSRSHALLQVHIKLRQRHNSMTTNTKTSKLVMVDLAGSEKGSATGFSGARFREGSSINKSLLALSNCIRTLANGRKFCSYRDSKLTRILKDSLGGDCRTVMIANISPTDAMYEDTLNTLRYAEKAKKIACHAKKNVMSVNTCLSQYTRVVEEMAAKIEILETQVAACHTEAKVRIDAYESQLVAKEEELENKMYEFEFELNQREDLITRLKHQLAEANQKLNRRDHEFLKREETLQAREAIISVREFDLAEKEGSFTNQSINKSGDHSMKDNSISASGDGPSTSNAFQTFIAPTPPQTLISTERQSQKIEPWQLPVQEDLPTPHQIEQLPRSLEDMNQYLTRRIKTMYKCEQDLLELHFKREKQRRTVVLAKIAGGKKYEKTAAKMSKSVNYLIKELRKSLDNQLRREPLDWSMWRCVVQENMFQVSKFNLYKFFITQYHLIQLTNENKLLRGQVENVLTEWDKKSKQLFEAASLLNRMHNLLKHYGQLTKTIDNEYEEFVSTYCEQRSVHFGEADESMASSSQASNDDFVAKENSSIILPALSVTTVLTEDPYLKEFNVDTFYRNVMNRLISINNSEVCDDELDKLVYDLMKKVEQYLPESTSHVVNFANPEDVPMDVPIIDEPQTP